MKRMTKLASLKKFFFRCVFRFKNYLVKEIQFKGTLTMVGDTTLNKTVKFYFK